jgi:hypothetical protein
MNVLQYVIHLESQTTHICKMMTYLNCKSILNSDSNDRTMFSQGEAKIQSNKNRYDLLKQRILRNSAFRKPIFGSDIDSYYKVLKNWN